MNLARKIWHRGIDMLPTTGFHFDRPLVLLQSDDWGRAGLRDHEGLKQLRSAGIMLGERPYDFYTLETAEDLAALRAMLRRHRDSGGRHPCIEMNFVVANLDSARMNGDAAGPIQLLPLAEGLPAGWARPNLIEGYREGIAGGVFRPALHGTTHFCRAAVERNVVIEGKRGKLLRSLWQAGTPYIHWRMPWIGYEYWDPEQPDDERFLTRESQYDLIGQAVGWFAKLFSSLPQSACAPGYRANDDTHRAWAQHGVRVAQSGPGVPFPPHFGRHDMLHLTRTVEFEPATDAAFSLEKCLRQAERCFEVGIPVIVSVHSINFHSTVEDFRSRTLRLLDEFLSAIESKHTNVLYVHDEYVRELAFKGRCSAPHENVILNVTRKNFVRARTPQSEA